MNKTSQKSRPLVIASLITLAIGILYVSLTLTKSRLAVSTEVSESAPAEEAILALPAQIATDLMYEQWGIEVKGIRLAVGGNMLDFRYSVQDPAKAGLIQKERSDAYLLDQATGAKFSLADTLRTGSGRRSGRDLAMGSTYSLNFPNPGHHFKSGSKVTVVMGGFRAKDLTVE